MTVQPNEVRGTVPTTDQLLVFADADPEVYGGTMSGWDEIAARVKADIAAEVEEANQRALSAVAARQEIEACRGSVEVDGVRVEVDPAGRLILLDLDPVVLSRGVEGVCQAVLKAAWQAQGVAAGKVAAIAEREFGAGSDFAERIRAEVEARLGPEPETPQKRGLPDWAQESGRSYRR